ncbi:flagellar biosynthesis protein FlhF [Noviherbaspirillum cavernae]|uniref:Flagellar biosynthesis protein FlhF n=1 Tax=Noviherbaspirillum cavernae TaxID=2320862 RepID=A0A418X0A1_9BURK|nr:flagellar biosynthesis protein FlhF [Noviherbaspirillum cavernae]RJG05927.1 flagellar biosynthesis protein FlhF [Noviherbaspirillum cavernae]
MNVKKFFAKTSREAWRMVRDALGPDAVILSNREVNGQVEILALPIEDMASLAEPAGDKKVQEAIARAVAGHVEGGNGNPAPALLRRTNASEDSLPERTEPSMDAMSPKEARAGKWPEVQRHASTSAKAAPVAPAQTTNLAPRSIPKDVPADVPHIDLAEVMNELRTEFMTEIRSMRGALEEQLAEIAWSGEQKRDPMKTLVLREMLAAGFSATLARYLAEKLPAGDKPEDAMNWIKAILGRNLSVISNESQMLEKGGVFALVGPTGVGKTTTTAKLAARCVMRHGAGALALITTDGYRIGAYEQLRIYGKILGVMVHSVKDETDLRIALDELKTKHTVLIDTVGMGQRDKMVAEQVAMLQGVGTEVKRLLCLSATSTGETLSEVVRSYLGDGLAGCIVTKLDEAATIGNVLDVMIRRKLNLFYVANGQRVPEDLHVANQHYLVDRAFKLKRETGPFQLQDHEVPMVVANGVRGTNDKSLQGVKLG